MLLNIVQCTGQPPPKELSSAKRNDAVGETLFQGAPACPLGHSRRPALRPHLGEVLLLAAPTATTCPDRLPITDVLPLARAVGANGIGLTLRACWLETQGRAYLSVDALF